MFVGGSTADKYLREWVKSELDLEEMKFDCNPSYIVARGVAEYAKMVEDGTAASEVTDVTARLSIELSTGQTETIIEENSSIPITETHMIINDEDTRYLNLNLYQGNNVMAVENTYIGTLVYDYGSVVKKGQGVVEVDLTVDRNGHIKLSATDMTRNITQDIKLIMR